MALAWPITRLPTASPSGHTAEQQQLPSDCSFVLPSTPLPPAVAAPCCFRGHSHTAHENQWAVRPICVWLTARKYRPSQPQRGRNRACARADVGDATVSIVAHHHAARIARQPLGRFRRNVSAALDDRLPARVGVCQHGGVDVDHDLIPFAWTSRIDSVVQRRLGDQCECVRLLLLDRRRFRRTVLVARSRGTVRARPGRPRPRDRPRYGRTPRLRAASRRRTSRSRRRAGRSSRSRRS